MIKHKSLHFSNEDKKIMKHIFTTKDDDERKYILEEDHGFELCVHTRNFMAGILITTNIANAVRLSRRIIILLTQYVLKNTCS